MHGKLAHLTAALMASSWDTSQAQAEGSPATAGMGHFEKASSERLRSSWHSWGWCMHCGLSCWPPDGRGSGMPQTTGAAGSRQAQPVQPRTRIPLHKHGRYGGPLRAMSAQPACLENAGWWGS